MVVWRAATSGGEGAGCWPPWARAAKQPTMTATNAILPNLHMRGTVSSRLPVLRHVDATQTRISGPWARTGGLLSDAAGRRLAVFARATGVIAR